ncbi:hypothetical protein CHRYSEO8AT_490006 [Chryseobacterium sp. 8AT]|nr:hypothetical protein CHRYSEO8AT_490006 [Chryseobacterium sp. 8AT]
MNYSFSVGSVSSVVLTFHGTSTLYSVFLKFKLIIFYVNKELNKGSGF